MALSGRADAGAVLDSLEQDTSLLSGVDKRRDAYRLQPQLRTYLLADVRRDERHPGRLARAPVSPVAPSSDPLRRSRPPASARTSMTRTVRSPQTR